MPLVLRFNDGFGRNQPACGTRKGTFARRLDPWQITDACLATIRLKIGLDWRCAMLMSRLKVSALVLATALLVPGVALSQAKVTGDLLTDEAGLTLYTFDNDATVPGRSACTGACLNMWTPLFASADAKATGDYTLVKRDDGQLQWAYKGKPLYRWYNDKKPGDKDGDGLRRAWHVARP